MSKNGKPPRRLSEREGESRLITATVPVPPNESKPFDASEKKLSLALDGIVDVVETYRELHR